MSEYRYLDTSRRRRTTIWLASCAAVLATCGLVTARTAAAQPIPTPTPIASGTLGSAASSSATDRATGHLLDLARRDLAHGQSDVAQRTLEQLIARFPDSAAAAEARRLLFSIYASNTGIAGAVAATAPSPVAASNTQAGQPASFAAGANQREGQGRNRWRTTVVSIAALQDQLRNTLGDRVFFSAGSAQIGARARIVLMQHAQWLKQRPGVGFVIEGHADDRASGADDEALSAARARAVRDRLINEGIEPARLLARGMGARNRVATCESSDCAAQNRRVVIAPDLAERLSARAAADGQDPRAAGAHSARILPPTVPTHTSAAVEQRRMPFR